VASYDEIKNHQNELIRKALTGSAFVAPFAADPITSLTTYHPAVTGPPAVPAFIDLTELPDDWDDLGYLTDDGISTDNEVTTSDTSAWQSVEPVRSDTTSDVDTITVVAEETKLLTIGLYTGALISPTSLAANTAELGIAKPARPSARYWRVLTLAVDGEGDDEFFMGRFFPRVKVTSRTAQSYAKGDDPVTWGVTLTAYPDSALGYSAKWLFGGNGWKAKAAAMGFTIA
jgi:hypothetical protein